MSRVKKIYKSTKTYISNICSHSYTDLEDCIKCDSSWEDGHTRTNPSMYELFTTHEHLGVAKEHLFKFAGLRLTKEQLNQLADTIEACWRRNLPLFFPGYRFAILKDNFSDQIAFCRIRTGITDNPDHIRNLLTHTNSNIRWNALLSATIFPDASLTAPLLKSLDDESSCNVIQALQALGQNGNDEVAAFLFDRYLAPGKPLTNIDDFLGYDLFCSILKSGNTGYHLLYHALENYANLQPNLLEYLCEIMGKTQQADVTKLLLDIYLGCPAAMEGALNGLLSMEDQAFPMIQSIAEGSNPAFREKAFWFLANCYIPQAYPLLLAGLNDKNAKIREAAVHGIGRFKTEERLRLLLRASNDKSARVRARAVKTLGSLYETQLLALFQHHCYDKSPTVRSEAMCAITALESRDGLRFLTRLFMEASTGDKLKIIYSLYGYSGNSSHIRAFLRKAHREKNKLVKRELRDLVGTLDI